MSKVPEFVDQAWVQERVDQIFDRIERLAPLGFEQAGRGEMAKEFREVVVRHMAAAVRENVTAHLVPLINELIHHYLSASAEMKGERTVVTSYDTRGRIRETVKVPLWATVQVPSSTVDQEAGV